MINPNSNDQNFPRLSCGIVVRVHEDACQVTFGSDLVSVRYATGFPTPRVERVSPGHLVAITAVTGKTAAVVWRWYDAVILGEQDDQVRLWEPAHGEVLATPRTAYITSAPGTRAYLSAGLPGAEWWVAGPAVTAAYDADVDLADVERLYTDHDLWGDV